ncbi:TniQ family protein [Neorhizobium galegae]|uniref:TniQ family protein n=1 Tax=Neorhizobium galegae TaxID=399 RepID=UPI0021027297|nr:TniQ family protein [Neorhizobium galegae]MCQ1848564.1 TniQ family protein [Neorhizobium galegae]
MNRYANTLPFNANESLASYFSRLAAAFEYDCARDFGKDTGVNFDGLAFGDAQALEDFGDLLDCKPTMLKRGAIFKSRKTSVLSIGGQCFRPLQVDQATFRVCPHCLEADEEEYPGRRGHRSFGRLIWLVKAIRVCAVHQTRLVELSAPTPLPRFRHDFASHLAKARSSMAALSAQAKPANQDALDRYVTFRVTNDCSTEGWLEGIPLYAVIRVAESTGLLARRGPDASFADLSEDDRPLAAGHGFEAMASGELEFTRFLKAIARRSRKSARIFSGKSIFGALYLCLLRNPRDQAYEPFKRILRTVAIEELPLGPKDTIFGRVEQRKMHSVYTASKEFGVDDRLLKKLVSRSDLVGEDISSAPSNQICLEATSMGRIAAGLAESVEVPVARTRVNASRMQFETIVREKYLKPLAGCEPDNRSGRSLAIKRRFRLAELDDFLAQLEDAKTGEVTSDCCDMETACRKAGCSFAEALKLVIGNKLESVSGENGTGILGIRLDPHELQRKTEGNDHGCLTLRQVALSLPAKHEVVRMLIDLGLLKSVRGRNPTKRFLQTLVEPDEIERFKQEYVGAWEIARRKRLAMRKVRQHLDPLQPAFDPKIVGALFFKRSEIAFV